MTIDPTQYRVTADTVDDGEIDLDVATVLDPQTGERFTESDAWKFTSGRRGRPSLTGSHRNTPTFSVRVEPDIREQVERIAVRDSITAAEVTRRALREYVENHGSVDKVTQ